MCVFCSILLNFDLLSRLGIGFVAFGYTCFTFCGHKRSYASSMRKVMTVFVSIILEQLNEQYATHNSLLQFQTMNSTPKWWILT